MRPAHHDSGVYRRAGRFCVRGDMCMFRAVKAFAAPALQPKPSRPTTVEWDFSEVREQSSGVLPLRAGVARAGGGIFTTTTASRVAAARLQKMRQPRETRCGLCAVKFDGDRASSYFLNSSSSSMMRLNASNGCAPDSRRPLMKKAGVPVTPALRPACASVSTTD